MMITNSNTSLPCPPPHTDLESSIGQFSEFLDRIRTSLFEEMEIMRYTKRYKEQYIIGPKVAGTKTPKIVSIMDFRQGGKKQNNTKQTNPNSSEGLNNPLLL